MTLRTHLTFANACSVLALLVATGTGTAYAAATVRSADIVNGQVKTVDLGSRAVTSAKIKDGAVARADLGTNSVGAAQIAADAVSAPELGAGSVGASEILDAQIGAAELAIDSVGASEIADSAIDGGEIVDNSLTSADLAAGSVNGAELAGNSIVGSNVVNDSLTFADLASGTATGSVSLPAADVANGRCEAKTVGVGGAETGDAVVFSVRGAMQSGVFFYGTQVTSSSAVVVQLCNLSGTTMSAITNLPVRVLTFH